MADNLVTTFGIIATKDNGAGVHHQKVLIQALLAGGGGALTDILATALGLAVDVRNVVGVTGPLTNAELRAAGVPVLGPLTNAELRAAAVPVSRARVPLTGSAPTFATVGAASGVVLAANAARKGLTLVNTSPNWISLAFAAPAVLYSGISIAPNGSYTMGEYDFSTQEIRAVASAAGSNLAIQEFV